MSKRLSFFQKHAFLLGFFFFIFLDCYNLYVGNYHSRLYSKPPQMIFLFCWFFRNTTLGRVGVPPQTLTMRFCVYSVLILATVSDVCGLSSDFLVWSACQLLYIPIYVIYLVLLIDVMRKGNEERKVIFYLKKVVPTFIIMLIIAITVLWKAVGLGHEFYHWCLYIHSFIICLMATICANMWGSEILGRYRVLFAIAIFFLCITNITYCFDEFYFSRRHPILDLFVSMGNGLYNVLMLFGVINMFKLNKKL